MNKRESFFSGPAYRFSLGFLEETPSFDTSAVSPENSSLAILQELTGHPLAVARATLKDTLRVISRRTADWDEARTLVIDEILSKKGAPSLTDARMNNFWRGLI